MGVNDARQVVRLIEQSQMSGPQIAGNMAVTPLLQPDAERYRDILSMSLALELGQLQVSETGNVPSLDFSTQRATLIRAGEAVLGGGNQDRIVRSSRIVEGNEPVDVFCIEAGRWHSQDRSWMHIETPVSLRRAVLGGANQQQVWGTVQNFLGQFGVSSNTSALGAIYEMFHWNFEQRASRFKWLDDQVGMIITIDGKVSGVEFFGDKMSFSRERLSLLTDSYIPDAYPDTGENMTREDVVVSIEDFLEELAGGQRNAEVVKLQAELVYASAV